MDDFKGKTAPERLHVDDVPKLETSVTASALPIRTAQVLKTSPQLGNDNACKSEACNPQFLKELSIVLQRCDDPDALLDRPVCKNAVSQLKSKSNRIIKHSCALCSKFEDVLNQPQHLSAPTTARKIKPCHQVDKKYPKKSLENTQYFPICNVCELCGSGFVMPHSLGTDSWGKFNDAKSGIFSVHAEDFTQVSEMEYLLQNQMKAFHDVSDQCQNYLKSLKEHQFYHCPHCPIIYRRSDFLQNHLVVHTTALPFSMICEFCYQFFSNGRNLQKHVFRMHKQESLKMCRSSSSDSDSSSSSDSLSPQCKSISSSSSSSPTLLTDASSAVQIAHNPLRLMKNKTKVIVRVPVTSGNKNTKANYESFLFHLKDSCNNMDVQTTSSEHFEDEWKSYINIEYPHREHNYTLRDEGNPYYYSPVIRLDPDEYKQTRPRVHLKQFSLEHASLNRSTLFPEVVISDFDPMQYEDIPMFEFQNKILPTSKVEKYCISLSPDIVMAIHTSEDQIVPNSQQKFLKIIKFVAPPLKSVHVGAKCGMDNSKSKVMRKICSPILTNLLFSSPVSASKDYTRVHLNPPPISLQTSILSEISSDLFAVAPVDKQLISSVETQLIADSSNEKVVTNLDLIKMDHPEFVNENNLIPFSILSTETTKLLISTPTEIPEISSEVDIEFEFFSDGDTRTTEMSTVKYPAVTLEKLEYPIRNMESLYSINKLRLRKTISMRKSCTGQLNKTKLKCRICGLMCVNSASLKSHMKFYSGGRHSHCVRCNKAFESCSEMESHVCYLEMENAGIHLCTKCPMAFQNEVALTNHNMFHMVCRNCLAIFQDDSSFEKHMKMFHLFQLRTCKTHPSIISVQKETEICGHQSCQPPKCKYCDKVFTSYKDFDKHLTDHFKKGKFWCELCYINYSTPIELKNHMSTKHALFHSRQHVHASSNTKCSDGEIQTSVSQENRCFQTNYTKSFLPKADNTGKNDTDSSHLLLKAPEVLAVTDTGLNKNSERPVFGERNIMKCSETPIRICRKRKLRFPNLLGKKKLKRSNKPNNDDNCTSSRQSGDNFSNELDLLEIPCLVDHGYILRNPKSKSYVDNTSAAPNTIKPLQTGNSVIGLNNTAPCDQCNSVFSCLSALKKHQSLVHNNPTGYKCDLCCLVFNLENNFQKHMLLHVDKSSVICAVCARTYTKVKHLKAHFRCVHQKSAKPKKHMCVFNMQTNLENQQDLCSFKCAHCDLTYKSKMLF